MRTTTKYLFGVSVGILVGVVALIAFKPANRGEVVLKNATTKEICTVTLMVDGQTFTTKDIPANEQRTITFAIHGDSDYKVNVRYCDGTTSEKSMGYVTNGIDVWDTITISAMDMSLTNRRAEPRGY